LADAQWERAAGAAPRRAGLLALFRHFRHQSHAWTHVCRRRGPARQEPRGRPQHALSASQFGSDSSLVGRTIRLAGEPYTVIGVLPEGSAFDRSFPQLWTPLTFEPENMTRNFHWFGSFAKLKPAVTLDQARTQMDTIGARIARDYPDSNKGWGVVVERYADVLVGPQLRQSLLLLLASVGLVLLIGCVNLANIALAGGLARAREVAIRAALGASRLTLVRQFLTESVLLAVAGGVLGVAVGYGT